MSTSKDAALVCVKIKSSPPKLKTAVIQSYLFYISQSLQVKKTLFQTALATAEKKINTNPLANPDFILLLTWLWKAI